MISLIFGKYVGIIGFLILIVLSSGCVSVGGFIDVLNICDESSNFTELNKTANGTYSVEGVSFKCPDNWSVGILKEDGITTIAACQINDSSSYQPQFTIDIMHNRTIYELELINQDKNAIIMGKNVSNSIITIDGNKAYKSIFMFNDPVGGQSRIEQIYFLKNGKTYIITFSAADNDFDKEKANFDIILDSFKVQ